MQQLPDGVVPQNIIHTAVILIKLLTGQYLCTESLIINIGRSVTIWLISNIALFVAIVILTIDFLVKDWQREESDMSSFAPESKGSEETGTQYAQYDAQDAVFFGGKMLN